jgi:two-component system response regulator NreC
MDDSNPALPTRVLLADDRAILRDGLHAMLQGMAGVELVQGAELQPDVALIDLSMPSLSGLGAIGEIKRRFTQAKALVLTSDASEQSIRAALRAGADGYVLKDASRAELLMAIETVLRGKAFISPSALHNLVRGPLARPARGASLAGSLTTREREVLKLIAEGERNRQIAAELGISVKTVEKHRTNLMRKLKLHNTAALTSFAIEHRLAGKARPGRPR